MTKPTEAQLAEMGAEILGYEKHQSHVNSLNYWHKKGEVSPTFSCDKERVFPLFDPCSKIELAMEIGLEFGFFIKMYKNLNPYSPTKGQYLLRIYKEERMLGGLGMEEKEIFGQFLPSFPDCALKIMETIWEVRKDG